MKIPIPYSLILEKLLQHVNRDNIIGVKDAKYYVSVCFRVNHKLIAQMFFEMKDLGLIEFVNQAEIKILRNSF
ncbi:hypothetical protein LCGC14_1445190 [marine sediment metagenome]|uniref:Uncharacterized protein n=1 Tax=marine sediment metagenome TaxID=412755 RepID=A0A0F9K5Q2_9ZZZZ